MAKKVGAGKRPAQRPVVLPDLGVAVGFRPELLDFERGIHVGNLEENERITRILKLALEARYGQPFVTERWGRGVYWQWIGFLPRANRAAKPQSSRVSFGCSKFFVTVDTGEKLFKCGLQVERGYITAPPDSGDCLLGPDWDWHRLIQGLKAGTVLARELERLVKHEGFLVQAGEWEEQPAYFSRANYAGAAKLRRALESASETNWAGFQLFYAMDEHEVRGSTGLDLVESMLAVFREVTPAMNACMQIALAERGGRETDATSR
jgi:hypothetical protein